MSFLSKRDAEIMQQKQKKADGGDGGEGAKGGTKSK